MFICKVKNDSMSYTLDTGVMFKSGLEVAEQQILKHVTSHYDDQVVEDFKEFFTDVKNAISLGLKSEHSLMYEDRDLDIKVDLHKRTLLFEDRSHEHLKITVISRYLDILESER